MAEPSEIFENLKRKKLINAIIYFIKSTKYCYKLKLLKLLYFLDFEHYRQTGKSVTGMIYTAWPMGPVADDLYVEMDAPCCDMADSINFEKKKFNNGNGEYLEIKSKKKFDSSLFSKRELDIMERIADFFKEMKSDGMTEYSHDRKLPWKKVYDNGKGCRQVIDYDLVLDAEPLVREKPTITKEDLDYLREAIEGI